MNSLFESWLLQSIVIFLIIGSVAGIAVGAMLLLRPQKLRLAGDLLNRWVSTRRIDQSLERTISVDPWFYRNSRISGALILLGALYILYFFTVKLQRADVIASLVRYFHLQAALAAVMLDALALSALLGALVAALVSVFLLLRPSMLRSFERGANQWVSLRRAMKPVEVTHQEVDEYVFGHAQQAGVLLVLGSLYVLVMLMSWIGH